MICAKCHNYEFGKCVKGNKCPAPSDYSCFENRILHISDKGEYGDEMNKSQVSFMKGYCGSNRENVLASDYTGTTYDALINDCRINTALYFELLDTVIACDLSLSVYEMSDILDKYEKNPNRYMTIRDYVVDVWMARKSLERGNV